MRDVPLASHGLVKEPGPVEPAGQSCGGSGAADGAGGGALAEGTGAEADGAALADGAGAGALSSLEQATTAKIAAVARRVFRIGRILVDRVTQTGLKPVNRAALGC